ncbi:MAG TPA: MlaD family protein [Bradyrhizobium sp.]|nr:MlaD family protein [Bradyrhizobium sp.]
MDEGKRYVRLGVFVVTSLCVMAAVLFLVGGRKLFQPTFTFETYFNGSVSGLELGSPVRFRGVPLGQVSEILTSAATYERNVPLDKRREYVVVRAKVNFSADEAEQLGRDAVQLVKRGLRAQTQLAGLTGQQYLAIDFLDAAKYPPLEFQWEPKYTYVPSAPSLTGEIITNVQAFLSSLNEADVKTLARNVNALVVNLDRKVTDTPIAELVGNANATVVRIDRILAAAPIDHALHKIDSAAARFDDLLADPGLKQTVDNAAAVSGRLRNLAESGALDRMIKHIDGTAERLDALIGDNQYDVRVIVQNLRVTADNLRVLSENLKRNPAGVLLGGPPEKIQLPGTSR